VILPSDRWRESRRQWEWADDLGFSTAWTYDHVRWGGMPEGPWHSAVPVLGAVAAVTTRIRLGTLVATPNFRHPVTLAREALALDDLSDGRLDLGLV
jgi:alkanesulfonate monooxygenase SsuD/methylene tetrahydromethanopterin reductase-like flavin-dependent oxidoreductase (luciferase family)